MKYYSILCSLWLAMLLPGYSALAQNTLPPVLQPWQHNYIHTIAVMRLSDGKMLYHHSADTPAVPASLMKLFTAGTSLATLGGDHVFQTHVFTDSISKQHNQIVAKNLYIQGGGDPYLVNEKLWELANALKHRGIQQFSGNIVIDQSLFSGAENHLKRNKHTYSTNAYNAPLKPLSVNFSTYEVWLTLPLRSHNSTSLAPQLSLLPYPLQGVTTLNRLKSTEHGSSKANVVAKDHGKQTILIASGNIPLTAPHSLTNPKRLYRAVHDAGMFAGKVIKAFLAKEGISIAGNIQESSGKPLQQNPNLIHLYSLKSYPLRQMIRAMNSYSNNFIADMLALYLGSKTHSKTHPKSHALERGTASILSHFQSISGDGTHGTKIFDGSGLDHRSKVSGRGVVLYLTNISRSVAVFPDLFASLPAPHEEGTLKKRFMKNHMRTFARSLRAKTGSLSQPRVVSALAGYGEHKTHGLYAFVLIHNSIPGKPASANLASLQEKALMEIIQHHLTE